MAGDVRGRAVFFFRALLALSMGLGYYLLSFVVAAVALVIAALMVWAGVPIIAALLPLAVAFLSAWTALKVLFSRAPERPLGGLALHRDGEPALFDFVEAVAKEMRTRPPAVIHLDADANAFVAERGGFFGIGRRRVLGLGYLTLRSSTRSELRATLAHEFGHYVSGDTALGALVHRSHLVLVGSLAMLSAEGSWHFAIAAARDALVFALRAYTKAALRVSLAVARRQELEADRHAVRVAGKRAHVRSLARAVHDMATLSAFVAREVEPLCATEAWPAEFWRGFDAFEVAVRSEIAGGVSAAERGPYDTHPTLQERVAFAEALPDSAEPQDDGLAIELLARPDDAWHRLEHLAAGDLPRVPWSEAAARRGRSVHALATALCPSLQGLLVGRTWSELARSGVDLVAAEGPHRIVVAAYPEMRQLTAVDWAAVAPAVFAKAFGAIVAMALVHDRAGVFTHVFGAPLQVRIGDDVVCPWTLARESAASAEGLARLRAALAPP